MFFISLLGQLASHVSSVFIQYELLWWVYKATGDIGELVIAGILVLLPAAIFRGLTDMVMEQGDPRAGVIMSLLVEILCMIAFFSGIDLLRKYNWVFYAILPLYGIARMVRVSSSIALTRHFVRQALQQRFDLVSDIMELVVLLVVVGLGMVFLSDQPVHGVLVVCMLFSVFSLLPAFLFPYCMVADSARSERVHYGFDDMTRLVSDVIGGVQFVILLALVLAVLMVYFLMLSVMA